MMTNENWKAYFAEFIGTLGFIVSGAGAVVALDAGADFGLLGVAFAHGLALAALGYSMGRLSGGHFNPAVSIAFWVSRRMNAAKTAGYVISQLVGSVAAVYILQAVVPVAARASKFGVPMLHPGTSPLEGIFIEAVFTFFLTWVIVALTSEGASERVPIAAGFVVAVGIIVAGQFTGGAFNPARAFGPAFASETWANHSVWWIGPLIGAVAAALVHRIVAKK